MEELKAKLKEWFTAQGRFGKVAWLIVSALLAAFLSDNGVSDVVHTLKSDNTQQTAPVEP